MDLHFTKMNGAGNDFVVVDNRDGALNLNKAQIAQLCDRHRGIGADGLLAVEPPQNGADFRMRYYNADGGEAEMCGNGARCFARFASRLEKKGNSVSFETIAGSISAQFIGEKVEIAMSEPKDLRLDEPLPLEQETVAASFINTGVPHAVIFVEDLEAIDIQRLGSEIRHHANYAPQGANVNFVKKLGAQQIAVRTYERGVEGETLACGTGVTAAALVFHALGGAASPVSVKVRSGETLEIGFEPDGETCRNVTLTGPADFVFEGTVAI